MPRITVPFKIDEVMHGLAEAEGILSFDGEKVVLEFRTADSLVGLVKSRVKKVAIGLHQIEEIDFRKGLWSCRLRMRLSELKAAARIPNSKSGEMVLCVSKKYARVAESLVADLQSDLTNRKVDEIIDETRTWVDQSLG